MSKTGTSGGTSGEVFGPDNRIEGQFFHFVRNGDGYDRSGPFAWHGDTNGARPSRMPRDTDAIESEVGKTKEYGLNDRGTADGYLEPGFRLSEWHHWNNPYSGYLKQRQFWGRYGASRPTHTLPGRSSATPSSGNRGTSTTNPGGSVAARRPTAPATPSCSPWDTRFSKLSVFRGRTYLKNFFGWGSTYTGCHFWKQVDEHVIDTATGAAVGAYRWITPVETADPDGSPPGEGLLD